jgi:hypothetical protein
MKLLWLIGIEGSGHHMIRDVLRDFLASREVIDKGAYYPLWLQRWDGEQDPLPRQSVRNVLEESARLTSQPYGKKPSSWAKASLRSCLN